MLSPLLMLLIYYFVFRYIIGVRTPGYLVYLVVGIVYWTFFQDCSFSGLTALGARAAVLKSVRLPASWVVIAGALSTTITLAINTVALIAVLAASGRLSPLFPLALLPLVLLVVLASGTSFLVAVAHVRFRDTGLIWSVLLQALFWLTPIVYTVAEGPLRNLLYLNPLARCLDLIRWFLVYGHLPPVRFVAVTAAASLATFALGAWLLRRQERAMPEAL
jgi:ABC-type polysaccharide/polyol phosphate export permease